MTHWNQKYKQTYRKEAYSWGELRILRMGNAYTCIIHPEHLAAINRGEAFTDEQGMRWSVSITDGIVTLCHTSYEFTIALAELNA
jgi:glutamyl/glutaminyl-tRNA synthetase